MRVLCILILCLPLSPHFIKAQRWEIYAGINYSNINHYEDGQQIVRSDPVNAPRYMFNMQAGLNRNFAISPNVILQLGVRYQTKGSRVEAHQVFPVDTLAKTQMQHLMIPANIQIKLLKSREFYLNGGLSGGLVIGTIAGGSRRAGTALWSTQIDGQIGFRFPLIDKVSGQFNYSQGFKNIRPNMGPHFSIQPRLNVLHHAYEFSIIYSL